MLADDELDFEFDLADLGDLEGFDPNAMTAEELESQLGVDLDIDLEPISEESLSKAASAKEATGEKQDKKAEGKKTEDKKTENKKAEDKKAVEVKKDVDTTVKQATSPKVPDQEEKKRDQAKKFEKKPIPSTLDNQHNSYKNRNFSNNNRMNYYAMQQQAMFFPQAQANFMGMNGMFPYPQQQNFNTPNRIYVNPNFKGRPQIPTMGNHQQPKEMQYGNAGKQNMTAEDRAREELLDKKRKEAAESLRRRQEAGTKRTLTDGPTSEPKRKHADAQLYEPKRIHTNGPLTDAKRPATQQNQSNPVPPNHGFSIRGAAKAKASIQERPVDVQKEEDKKPKVSVLERLRDVRKEEDRNPKVPAKPPISARLQRREQASPLSKKVENGKTNELVISNLNENTTFQDIKKLIDDSSAIAQITYQKGESTSTLLFESIDSAVAFRRKYNRSKVGDSHVTIAFKK